MGVEDQLDEFSLLRGDRDVDSYSSSDYHGGRYDDGYDDEDFSLQHGDPVLPDYVRCCLDRLLRPTTASDVHVGMYRANIRAAIQACHDCINGIQ